MTRIFLGGPKRKQLLLEVLPKLGRNAAGFTVSPILEKFETVGFKLKLLDGREVTVAHQMAEHGKKWGRFRVMVEKIDSVATDLLLRPSPNLLMVIDEISEMLLYSRNFQTAFKRFFEARTHFLATLGEKPAAYIAQLRKLRGPVMIDALDSTVFPARRRLFKELRLPPPNS